MAKLTKAQHAHLLEILLHLEKVQNYIASDQIAICSVKDQPTTTIDYVRVKPYMEAVDRHPDDAKPLTRVTKDIGSDLARLPTAIHYLSTFILNN